MTTTFHLRDDLGHLESRLFRHLFVMSLLSFAVGGMFAGLEWGIAAALGPLAALAYYRLLARHTRNAVRHRVHPGNMLASLFLGLRQVVSIVPPLACFATWGEAGWACLATLVLSRHWIVVVAWPVRRPISGAV